LSGDKGSGDEAMIWPHTLRDAKHLRHPGSDGAARRVNTASVCVEEPHGSRTPHTGCGVNTP